MYCKCCCDSYKRSISYVYVQSYGSNGYSYYGSNSRNDSLRNKLYADGCSERMYISANHGGPNCTSAANSTGRVDVMKVSSHHVQPPVYYHYTGKDPAGPKQKPTTKDPKQEKGVPMSGPDDLPDADESVMT